MKKSFKFLSVAIAIILLFALSACGKNDKTLSTKEITVGVTGGPHEQIMREVAKLAKKDGLTIKLKVFNDYNTPNTALSEGSLDANSYQTLTFLNTQKKDKGYKITQVFKTVVFPMGVYSDKIKNLKDLKKGDSIAVPNDPANELRALKLFERAGVIKLKKGIGEYATKKDIVENKLNLKVEELNAESLPSQLDEVTAAAINTNFAMGAGLTINKDAIYHEPIKNNPYPNYFVVRTSNKNDEVVKKIEKYYHSDTIKKYIKKQFGGSVVPAW
ncbi:MetQ/NlpA family ABC transporter substrate-binding protein [Heyndrickxia ginsengihumi]|uniref:Lipoprotein n=1 Tax=Heyndrickxia ginsengihumi TaxID=363870 RepID=A0A0A6VDE2_9BACI|nr:MetQ/NlpA family ABC transporter substrate-binding protein [Heyndrickxia ginsengihumi]KHD85601.1 dioxygenase [Heyndrickxia ginsengihumi]MBE6182873.1 MetQ/NlpA family ABC transporter substrate-binding protein [Bacillus sp. (in: firmicutes)]MCM3023891.1 MetQ/NlpA family ABC transporter substrate-binding protein [Heyndrickxia ginsengihumi]NEY19864.1 MetQ/NlpA family ABC transporter substrate-binding protein [Heyndrickxia ginsengihumi]